MLQNLQHANPLREPGEDQLISGGGVGTSDNASE